MSAPRWRVAEWPDGTVASPKPMKDSHVLVLHPQGTAPEWHLDSSHWTRTEAERRMKAIAAEHGAGGPPMEVYHGTRGGARDEAEGRNEADDAARAALMGDLGIWLVGPIAATGCTLDEGEAMIEGRCPLGITLCGSIALEVCDIGAEGWRELDGWEESEGPYNSNDHGFVPLMLWRRPCGAWRLDSDSDAGRWATEGDAAKEAVAAALRGEGDSRDTATGTFEA